MEYREGTVGDLDQIVDLIRAAIETMRSQGIDQWDELYPVREDFREDIEKGHLFLAFSEGRLAGLYVISKEADDAYLLANWTGETEKAYVLHRFCISPAFQNQGIGREVLSHIEEQIREMGYETVRLDVFQKNPYAQKLYRKNGYLQAGTADWRKGRFDLLEKKL